MTLAVVFPGQGSQSLGMLAKISDAYPSIKQTFIEASNNLDYDLWALTQHGPVDRLNATACTQPALLVAGVAIWRVWQTQGGRSPVVMAGHSLGEYTALVCAGALDFGDAVKLVEFRGQAMQAAVPTGAGAMAAILGLADEAVESACREAAHDQVVAAVNYNAPGQVVIAGHKTAVERAGQICKTSGAKRVILLPVSVPSHCALMQPAAEQLAAKLATITLHSSAIPVIHNADVAAHTQADEIRKLLKAQLYSPVRWVETIRLLASQGVTKVVELGPGGVLAGLGKRIDKTLETYAVYDPAGLDTALVAITNEAM
ncbi:MAG TPA: ACP S-malonyltransferase [Gammaproteobacteria bacterium]|nr:ACP S-malonyltransferase [Gammaproteobacteria bacterium]HVC29058.1 ACP S-malonyltransferase [Gammaproteobacteria bacterium]